MARPSEPVTEEWAEVPVEPVREEEGEWGCRSQQPSFNSRRAATEPGRGAGSPHLRPRASPCSPWVDSLRSLRAPRQHPHFVVGFVAFEQGLFGVEDHHEAGGPEVSWGDVDHQARQRSARVNRAQRGVRK